MTAKPKILQFAHLPDHIEADLKSKFDVLEMPDDEAEWNSLLALHGASFRGMCVRHAHIDDAMLAKMPNLEVISSYSAGLDGIDTEAARRRGIVIHNTSHILAEEVADLALVLSLSLTRGTVSGHEFVRSGRWDNSTFPLGRSIRALNTGIIGLGHIGAAVARRFSVMGTPIAYYGPRKKPVAYEYFDNINNLAEWADLLIVTCPATEETLKLVNHDVLQKLGSSGFLVNVSRGTVVDQAALVDTLAKDGIAGAALDVFEIEPHVPESLRNDPRLVLSPHMGSGTVETRNQMGVRMIEALVEHFGLVEDAAQPSKRREARAGS